MSQTLKCLLIAGSSLALATFAPVVKASTVSLKVTPIRGVAPLTITWSATVSLSDMNSNWRATQFAVWTAKTGYLYDSPVIFSPPCPWTMFGSVLTATCTLQLTGIYSTYVYVDGYRGDGTVWDNHASGLNVEVILGSTGGG